MQINDIGPDLGRLNIGEIDNADSSRKDTGHLDPDARTFAVNLAEICEEAVESVLSGHPHRYSALENEPKSSKSFTPVILNIAQQNWSFNCSPGAIREILINLVSNSIKYTRNGHVIVELDSTYENNDNNKAVRIKVKDTGQGMSQAFLKSGLYQPFTQESTLAPGLGVFSLLSR